MKQQYIFFVWCFLKNENCIFAHSLSIPPPFANTISVFPITIIKPRRFKNQCFLKQSSLSANLSITNNNDNKMSSVHYDRRQPQSSRMGQSLRRRGILCQHFFGPRSHESISLIILCLACVLNVRSILLCLTAFLCAVFCVRPSCGL